MEIDRRKNYYLTVDTETANTLDDPLVYDIGGAVHDKKGKVYETFSFIVYDVFVGMRDLMKTAYYAEKIPQYEQQLKEGALTFARYSTIKKHIRNLCEKYDVTAIIAHNMNFDYRATATTQRFLTSSKYRYFFPYDVPLWDTLRMARETIGKQKSYQKWCIKNGYTLKNGKTPRLTAEILYRYMSGNDEFIESHTALEDVLIEKDIFSWCERQHKKMERRCFTRART